MGHVQMSIIIKNSQGIMIILTPIERETFEIFLKKARERSCRGLPLGSSRITAAVALVDRDMLTRVWDEMDYRIDVCHITNDGHIENL
jgi:hypothetical protein